MTKTLQPNVLTAGEPAGLSWRFWVVVPLTGIGAGIAAGLFMLLLHFVQHVAWSYNSGDFLDAVKRTSPYRRFAVLAIAGIGVGLSQFVMTRGPGGHAGELAETIWFKAGEMPFVHTICRGILAVVSVGMGASLGREAAPKQMGCLLGGAFARMAKLSNVEMRLIAACGAGAGLAAVYNVPFGGTLFALEVLLGSLALPLIPPALFACVIATWTSWLFLPNQATYHLPNYTLSEPQLIWSALAGPVIGLAAIAYVRAISWADAKKPSSWLLAISPFVVFAVLGLLATPYPELLGNGRGVVQLGFLGQLPILTLLPLVFLRPAMASACLASGSPGGLFTPTLTCGALLGAALGWAWETAIPSAPLGSYAVIGACAFLAATMQAPLAAFVLTLELTRSGQNLVIPFMLATSGASVIARLFEKNCIYSGRIHAGMAATRIRGIRTGTDFDSLLMHKFRTISTAARYPETLKQSSEASEQSTALYVIDESGVLTGFIPADFASACTPSPVETAIGTARDSASPTPYLTSDLIASEAKERLMASPSGYLPLVDSDSFRLLGAATIETG